MLVAALLTTIFRDVQSRQSVSSRHGIQGSQLLYDSSLDDETKHNLGVFDFGDHEVVVLLRLLHSECKHWVGDRSLRIL